MDFPLDLIDCIASFADASTLATLDGCCRRLWDGNDKHWAHLAKKKFRLIRPRGKDAFRAGVALLSPSHCIEIPLPQDLIAGVNEHQLCVAQNERVLVIGNDFRAEDVDTSIIRARCAKTLKPIADITVPHPVWEIFIAGRVDMEILCCFSAQYVYLLDLADVLRNAIATIPIERTVPPVRYLLNRRSTLACDEIVVTSSFIVLPLKEEIHVYTIGASLDGVQKSHSISYPQLNDALERPFAVRGSSSDPGSFAVLYEGIRIDIWNICQEEGGDLSPRLGRSIKVDPIPDLDFLVLAFDYNDSFLAVGTQDMQLVNLHVDESFRSSTQILESFVEWRHMVLLCGSFLIKSYEYIESAIMGLHIFNPTVTPNTRNICCCSKQQIQTLYTDSATMCTLVKLSSWPCHAFLGIRGQEEMVLWVFPECQEDLRRIQTIVATAESLGPRFRCSISMEHR